MLLSLGRNKNSQDLKKKLALLVGSKLQIFFGGAGHFTLQQII
jgi:hypothetical protein